MLSDMGGVFGFFLGVTMLNCLQKTWTCVVQSKIAIEKSTLKTNRKFQKFENKREPSRRYEVVIRPIEAEDTQKNKPPLYSET